MKHLCRVMLCIFVLACLCGVPVAADADDMYRRQLGAAGAEDLPRQLPADLQELLEQTDTDLLNRSEEAHV